MWAQTLSDFPLLGQPESHFIHSTFQQLGIRQEQQVQSVNLTLSPSLPSPPGAVVPPAVVPVQLHLAEWSVDAVGSDRLKVCCS